MIPAVGSAALSGAQTRNQGGQSGLLGGSGAIDGSSQSLWNALDPANISGKASSGHILSNILDPGNVLGQNQAANPLGQNGSNSAGGVPNVLPNLGAASMIPQMPQGSFQNFSGGPGIYNQMAAQSMGGQMFNPGAQSPQTTPKGAQQSQPNLQQLIQQMNAPRGFQVR
jgi:hypothetical protein